MKPVASLALMLLVLMLGTSLAFAQGGAAGGGTGGTGGAPSGGAGGIGGSSSGGAGTAQGGQSNVTTGGIGGRAGAPRDDGCTCHTARGSAGVPGWILLALAGGAWRRRAKLARTR